MRDLKFRAWDKKKNQWYGQDNEDMPTFKDFSLFGECLRFCMPAPDRVNNLIVTKYTGKDDKNGVMIYEGDFLVDRVPLDEEDLSLGYVESHMPVVWCKEKLMWCVDASFDKDGSYLTSLVDYFGDFLEVDGNIFENPEML